MKRFPIESIRAEGVSLGYDGEDPLLENASLDIEIGKHYSVAGESGKGKTTLLKAIAGLVEPVGGRILMNEKDIGDMTFEEFLPYRMSFGYTFDMGGLLSNKTVKENLMLPLLYHKSFPIDEAKKRVNFFMNLFELEKVQGLRPASIPGGKRKMTCVVRALISYPQVLLFDEPTVGIGPEMTEVLIKWLHEYAGRNSSVSILFASRDKHFGGAIPHEEIVLKDDLVFPEMERLEETKRVSGL